MVEATPYAARARSEKREQAERIGIDPAFISAMVENFYARVRADSLLGPIFDQRIADWPHHLGRMKAFWASVLHESGGYSGNPMIKHVAIPAIARPEFEHWLSLFDQTLAEIEVDPNATSLIAGRARMIAESLLNAIHIHRDGITDPLKLKGATHAG
ncbi:MAG: group III truncated hemoglobin [Proteobacteria bacterium]|nr:group III truncated hemoglobin [Pseudomonadota bacterium]